MASLSSVSEHFTKETLKEIVGKVREGASVGSWELDVCSNRGCSYLSEVNRLKIVGRVGEKEFVVHSIVKSLPRNEARRKTFRSAEFFSRETEFYDKIWKGFEEFQQKYKIPHPFNDLPKCYATFENSEHDFIAMEDLGVAGYRSADRQVEMDVAHCKLALSSLGRFHALSHAMRTLEPETFESLTSHMVDVYYAEKARDWYEEMAGLQISVARDALHQEYPGTDVEAAMHLFTETTSLYYSRMVQLTHTVNEYAVIGHGDCWLPNFMFNYIPETSTPSQLKLIDFQLVRLGSCVLDISFFLYSCTSENLRATHFDEMLQWYYEGVENILQQFELDPSKVFPKAVLMEEMKKMAIFGVGIAMEALPLCIMEEGDTTDMDTIEGSRPLSLPEVWKLKPIATQQGRRRLADVFKHAREQGYL